MAENIFIVSNLKGKFKNLGEEFREINREWKDIEKLKFIRQYLVLRLNLENNELYEKIFEGLNVINKDFYIHYSIIDKLLEKIREKSPCASIKNLDKKISELRNCYIVHREKNFFYRGVGYVHDISSISFSNTKYIIKPLEDFEKIKKHLVSIKKIVEK